VPARAPCGSPPRRSAASPCGRCSCGARRVLKKNRPDRGRRRPSRAPHGFVREYRGIS
jgi:hypothetical protein